MTLKIGQTLHRERYAIVDHLGSGGMGAVYLALDQNFQERYVAIKENLENSRNTQQQFQREANTLANLTHPNLPRVTNYFIEENGRQYLVMDYIDGVNLQQLLTQDSTPLQESQVVDWMLQVMDALAYMHSWIDPKTGQQTPIIHRDIKPSNIKQTADGRIMLVDFGIAKISEEDTTITAAKAHTPGYSPIEQYTGGTDERSDIYALGATLYCLTTRRTPPDAPRLAAQTAQLHNPRFYNVDLSRGLDRTIMRSMQLQPSERFQTIDDMRASLTSLRSGKGILPSGLFSGGFLSTKGKSTGTQALRELSGAQTVPDPMTGEEELQRQESQQSHRRSRDPRSAKWVLAAIFVILGLLLLAVVIFQPFSSLMRIAQPAETSTPGSTTVSAPASAPTSISPEPPDEASIADRGSLGQAIASGLTPTLAQLPTAEPSEDQLSTPTRATIPPTSTAIALVAPTDTATQEDTIAAGDAIQPSPVFIENQEATATSTPRATATDKPTSRATERPTPAATNTRLPTATRTATATDKPTATPTGTPTEQSSPTRTPTAEPTATPTPEPTLEPTPEIIATTIPPTTPSAPAPPPTVPSANINGRVSLISPLDPVLRGTVIFQWQTDIILADDEYFELIFWRPGEDPIRDGFSPVGASKQRLEEVRLDKSIEQLPQLSAGQNYLWGVRLVKLNPFLPLAHLGAQHQFRLEGSGGGGSSSEPKATPRG